MSFASPAWLYGLLLLPLLAAVEWWALRRDAERVALLVARPLWPRVARQHHPAWRWLRLSLVLLGAAGVVLALARPQWGIVREKVEREGVDVVLVLDTSRSMATEDVAPNRFFVARQALLSLVAQLEGDRLALVAFEGAAYPLVPLTLDADAVGLFLETLEPGAVPTPGTSVGGGLARGLELFVDKERHNKVMVLVSDGEDLEGEVEEAIQRAREAGVVIHAVGAGTERGEPVPDVDAEGNRVGFKKDEDGTTVVSRLHGETLERIARGTGGRSFRITPTDTSLTPLARAIEGMEQKTLAREFSYRKKERFQVPLGIGLLALALGLCLPFPRLRRRKAAPRRAAVAAALAVALLPGPAAGQAGPVSSGPQAPAGPVSPAVPAVPVPSSPGPSTGPARGGGVVDELLLRPKRLASRGRKSYDQGDHPTALSAFDEAARLRPADPAARFNLADGLYKAGRLEEAEALYRGLGADAASPLAAPSRHNLGNALYQRQDYAGAVGAYRDALRLDPDAADTRRNLELALRALQEQKREQQRQQDRQKEQKDQKQEPQPGGGQEKKQDEKKDQHQPQPSPQPRKSEEQKEQERFRQETGMPKERAMQLLDALQQNEKEEQKRLLLASPAPPRKGKDW